MTDNKEKKIKPHFHGHRQRMKEKILEKGCSSLTELEILECLLMYAIPRIDVKPLSKELIKTYGSLREVIEADPQLLMKHKGIKESSVCLLKLVEGACLEGLKPGSKKAIYLKNTESILNYCKFNLGHKRTERLIIIYLTNTHKVINYEEYDQGSANSITLDIKQIIKTALNNTAKYIILVHNHPSGRAQPSKNDIEFTKYIEKMLSPMEIYVIDHLIITQNAAFSIRSSSSCVFD